MAKFYNDTGVTLYVLSRASEMGSTRYEADLSAGSTYDTSNLTLSSANRVAFTTATHLSNNGTTIGGEFSGGIGSDNGGFSTGLSAYPNSSYWVLGVAFSHASTVNISTGTVQSGTARTKVGHKLLQRHGVRRDAIQSGSVEIAHLNFIATEGTPTWGGALADNDILALHDSSGDIVRGIELVDLKSYMSSSTPVIEKSLVLDHRNAHGGITFKNGLLSIEPQIAHFMSASAPTGNPAGGIALVASSIEGGGGPYGSSHNIYAMTGSKGHGCVTASLGFASGSRGHGFFASGSLKVYLNGIMLFGVRDYGGAERTNGANPIPHTNVDYRYDDKVTTASAVSGSRILLNPNLAMDSDDILTVEYLSGAIDGLHA